MAGPRDHQGLVPERCFRLRLQPGGCGLDVPRDEKVLQLLSETLTLYAPKPNGLEIREAESKIVTGVKEAASDRSAELIRVDGEINIEIGRDKAAPR